MALVLFLSCFCWRVITQSLVAIQCNMFRCFEDDFHVFLCPWFGKSTNPPIVKTLEAVCNCRTPAAATKYCGHDQEKAAFCSFLGTLLSCQRPGFAHAYFPFQIFSNFATADAELFLLSPSSFWRLCRSFFPTVLLPPVELADLCCRSWNLGRQEVGDVGARHHQ